MLIVINIYLDIALQNLLHLVYGMSCMSSFIFCFLFQGECVSVSHESCEICNFSVQQENILTAYIAVYICSSKYLSMFNVISTK